MKRFLVGRRVSSGRLEHTLLPKVLALPVFSSDALSSVIYAPQEVVLVLLMVSSTSNHLAMPISMAVAALMAIVVASYRQTIKAYPSGGGAYIVSKDNLGTVPGLIAAAALLVDYVLTVSVSIAAGVYAITSVQHSLIPVSVEMSVGFIVFVTLVNLRGTKESGTFFAIPVYIFIASIIAMVGLGVAKCVAEVCPIAPHVPPDPKLATAGATIGLFVILKAFSSGCAALTGVEAISNGVPAFKRPQSKNAANTLVIMGGIAIFMFLGIAYLASQAHATISNQQSVVAQVAEAVFGKGIGFYVVQIFSAAILVLAANTSFQDFPRLSAILAKDRYMPRQFINRGDRLVFSNGVLVLAAFSILLVIVFKANVDSLIHLYVVGVFTSFTLSQSGMIKHWLKEKHKGEAAAKGWQVSIVFNAIGAVTTAVVLVVVMITKFAPEGFPKPGAWISVVAMAVLALTFPVVHRHYTSVIKALRRGRVKISEQVAMNRVVLMVRDFDDSLSEALGYIRSFRPPEFRAVWVGRHAPSDLQERWHEYCPVGGPALEVVDRKFSLLATMREYVRGMERGRPDFISVVIPEMITERLSLYFLRHPALIRVKAGLIREPNVVITDVPVPPAEDGSSPTALIPNRVVALLFLSAINDATIRAVNYASTLNAAEIRAIHFALDPEGSGTIVDEWAERGSPIPLELTEAPFRDLTGPMLAAVRRETERQDTIVAVIIPEYVVKKRHRILHNQSALFVKRLFLSEPRTVLTSVPWTLEM